LKGWLSEVKENGNQHLVTILVGNKTDREEDRYFYKKLRKGL
jgi:GTPase SAR1 family protein